MIPNLLRSLLVALAIPFTISCTGLTIFVANSSSMAGTIPTLMPMIALFIAIVALLFFLLQIPFVFVKRHWFPVINALLIGCAILLWIQANVFNWNFGQLDGSAVKWSDYRHIMALELIVYVAVLGLILWQLRWFTKYAIQISCVLMLMQTVPLARPVARDLLSMRTKVAVKHLIGMPTTPEAYEIARNELLPKPKDAEPTFDPTIPSWKQYEITYRGLLDFSPERNVVLLVLDAYSTHLFQRMMKKDPHIGEWFSDFNFFRNHKSKAGTIISVPQMLTSYDYSITNYEDASNIPAKVERWNAEGALQKTLAESGFSTAIYTWCPIAHYFDHRWISNIRLIGTLPDSPSLSSPINYLIKTGVGELLDLTILRSLPLVCKPEVFDYFHPVQHFLCRFATPQADYTRLTLSASDVTFAQIVVENPLSVTSPKPTLKVLHLHGAHRLYNFNENFEFEDMSGIEGEERQGYAAILFTKRLLDAMKKKQVYDNSLIVILGDHGGDPDGMACIADWSQYFNPVLLVKRPDERHASVVHRMEYTDMRDITPTILGELGLTIRPSTYSVFHLPSDIMAERKKIFDDTMETYRNNQKLQIISVIQKKTQPLVSSDVTLKRSVLHFRKDQLLLYAGDDPDVWNKTASQNNAIIELTPVKNRTESTLYQGEAQIHINNTNGANWTNFWSCKGVLDVTNVADGEYKVHFLLPKSDGTYAKCIFPETITVVSGVGTQSSQFRHAFQESFSEQESTEIRPQNGMH